MPEVEESAESFEAAEALFRSRRALQLERGGLYVLRLRGAANPALLQLIADSLGPMQHEFGVKFLLLDDSASLVESEELEAAVLGILKKHSRALGDVQHEEMVVSPQ